MLTFRLFGIPIGVHLTFLFVALLGASAYRGIDIAIWTAAAFISILMHELGHALTARTFGAQGINVTLYGLGGLTSYSHGRSGMSHFNSFVVSAAGSFVGIVAGGAVWFLVRQGIFDGVSHEVAVFINSFIFTALIWGVLNWIPIVPLDGGHMVQSLISVWDEERAPFIGQVITWIAVAIVVPLAVLNGYQFGAIFVVIFALAGVREYQQKKQAREASLEADERAQQIASGAITSDEIKPAPPAPPTPPVEDDMKRGRQRTNDDFPI